MATDPEEYPPEVVATAASRVAAALAKDPPAAHSAPAKHDPAPTPPQQPSLPGTAPVGEPATQAGEKRTRTTVAKLLQKYQERVEVIASEIQAAEASIQNQQGLLDKMRFQHQFWLDAIAEINAD